MTDKEIIKALECCIKPTSDCENCPYYKKEECFDMAKRDALNLINRQQAENINLKGHLEQLKSRYDNAKAEIERLSSSAKQWEETAKDLLISKEKQQAEIENLNNFLYDAEGVNLVNYWYQQCEIAENGCRNLEEENKKLKAEIERLQKNSKKVLEICSRVIKANDERNNEIFQGAIEVVRAEAIKEFAERFVNNLPSDNDCNSLIAVGLVKTIIQNVKKEMAGDDK